MSEIKKKLIKLGEGDNYTASGDERVITEDHSIMDILRYAIECAGGDKSEIQCILELLVEDE